MRENLTMVSIRDLTLMHANNNSADQPVHPRSLISAFGISYLLSSILQLAPRKESFFALVFVAEQAGLGLTWSGIPDSFFSRQCP